jgi:hypothetical protein
MRCGLSDSPCWDEWSMLKALLPIQRKSAQVDDWRILNAIF